MTTPLNIQPNAGAQGPGVASLDSAGNISADGTLTAGKSVVLKKVSRTPTFTPNALTLYTSDGINLSTITGGGTPATVGNPPWRFDVTSYGATGNGTTDDTAAIQAAVNAAVAYAQSHSFYAEVYFPVPAVWYAINGALQQGGSTLGNAQIALPIIPTIANKVTLALIGQREASATIHWQQQTHQIDGVTLKSNSDTPLNNTYGEASIIGGPTPAQGYGTAGSVFSNMNLFVDGIQTMSKNTTNGIGGLDARGVACLTMGSYSHLVDAYPAGPGGGITGGSGSGSYFGVAFPNNGNNDLCYAESITVYGMTYGIIATEHTQISVARCIYCFDPCVVVGSFYSGPAALHGVTIQNLSVESVTTGGNHLLFVGAGAKCVINLDTEDVNVVITDQNSSRGNTGFVYLIGSFTSTITIPATTSGVTVIDTTVPAGNVASPPAVPATNTPLQNTLRRPAFVTITGGVVTAVKIDGVTQGNLIAGTFVVPAGIAISITYTGAPSWVWTLF